MQINTTQHSVNGFLSFFRMAEHRTVNGDKFIQFHAHTG